MSKPCVFVFLLCAAVAHAADDPAACTESLTAIAPDRPYSIVIDEYETLVPDDRGTPSQQVDKRVRAILKDRYIPASWATQIRPRP